ncbi:MAG: cytochrome c oxidase accessory protein CcoG [Polaromonas sp.]|uniref:cytochrome c oxidase accessory protein CcoG n=1 Tax=Polaromonas sp. TaxID=1869339 RepID=UPI001808C089|nr:cytochrome c oxidase accessory protein CcoG [Polaromonas sp.]NMM11061.1 cytochrome c oxidase accessory protein CcoG [Polaromonas sp.]
MKKTSSKIIPIRVQAAEAAGGGLFSAYEKQIRIYPKSVHGWFANRRWLMVWVTQAVFYGLPWLQWNGRQAVLFDLSERRFFVFGLMLHPQDFIYLAVLLVISALALFFVTAVAGRVWCGYACPQTVYTEVFLWFERRIEGDRIARMRLDAAPWSIEKITRKVGKQAVWLAIGLLTGFTFVGYFTPMYTLAAEAAVLSFSPWEWFWVLFYGFATYGNAGYMREQVCKYMCPYARFQNALIDMDSMVIAYDTGRGEARGSRPRTADPKLLGLGDCINCTLCVQVCPTGIDIRNGLQNECIACAACVDVCDDVMGKMGYAPGLIRYSSGNGMADALTPKQMTRRVLRPRVLIYGALLLVTSMVFLGSLSMRKGFAVDVIKDRGALARVVDDGAIENVYRLQITNGTEQTQQYSVEVSGLPGLTLALPAQLSVEPTGIGSLPVRLTLAAEAAEAYRGHANPIVFEIHTGQAGDLKTSREKSVFFVPR